MPSFESTLMGWWYVSVNFSCPPPPLLSLSFGHYRLIYCQPGSIWRTGLNSIKVSPIRCSCKLGHTPANYHPWLNFVNYSRPQKWENRKSIVPHEKLNHPAAWGCVSRARPYPPVWCWLAGEVYLHGLHLKATSTNFFTPGHGSPPKARADAVNLQCRFFWHVSDAVCSNEYWKSIKWEI